MIFTIQDPLLFNRVPNSVRELLVTELERCGGKDWEHFAVGLGSGLKERDKLRIKQGDVSDVVFCLYKMFFI